MKEIKAYVRPAMKDLVVDAVEELPDAPGLTVYDVEGWGKPKDGIHHQLTEVVLLEMTVSDDDLDRVLDTIEETARTGNYGDGKIFVSDVDQAIRIRDGKNGEDIV
ncbi:MAG: P-II family nitrogen regulator [bacterium]